MNVFTKLFLVIATISIVAACTPIVPTNLDGQHSSIYEAKVSMTDATTLFKLKSGGDVNKVVNGVYLKVDPLIETCDPSATMTNPVPLVTNILPVNTTSSFPFKLQTRCNYRIQIFFGKIKSNGLELEEIYATNSNESEQIIQKSDLQTAFANQQNNLNSGSPASGFSFSPRIEFTSAGANMLQWASGNQQINPNTPSSTINWPQATKIKYNSMNGKMSLQDLMGSKQYMFLMLTGKSCAGCRDEYPIMNQIEFLSKQNQSKCGMTMLGYEFGTVSEMATYVQSAGVPNLPPMLVGDSAQDSSTIELLYPLFNVSAADILMPFIGIIDRNGQITKVTDTKGVSKNWTTGHGVLEKNVNVLNQLCR